LGKESLITPGEGDVRPRNIHLTLTLLFWRAKAWRKKAREKRSPKPVISSGIHEK